MSTFKTEIPIHLDRIKALLPSGSTVDRLEWNKDKQTLEMFWHNGNLMTKYSWPWSWPLDDLKAQDAPEGVEVPGGPPSRIIVVDKAILDKMVADAKAVEQNVVSATIPLTATANSPKDEQSEKLAGQARKPSAPRGKRAKANVDTGNPAAVTATMERRGQGSTGGVSTESNG